MQKRTLNTQYFYIHINDWRGLVQSLSEETVSFTIHYTVLSVCLSVSHHFFIIFYTLSLLLLLLLVLERLHYWMVQYSKGGQRVMDSLAHETVVHTPHLHYLLSRTISLTSFWGSGHLCGFGQPDTGLLTSRGI